MPRAADLLMVSTYAPGVREGGVVLVERKTRDGLQRLQLETGMEIQLIAIEWRPGCGRLIDPVPIDASHHGIGVVLRTFDRGIPELLAPFLDRATLVYGMGVDVLEAALAKGVTIVPIVENTLGNAVRILRMQHGWSATGLRRQWQALREHWRLLRCFRRAALVHAIGAVAYESVVDRFPSQLYLDSRASAERIVDQDHVRTRVADLYSGRRLRLIVFGRLEPLKGPERVVAATVAMCRMGLDVELHVFGDGSSAPAIRRTIAQHRLEECIRLHGVVPFPELIRRGSTCDLFLAGNVQDDPSCAYLEAFGMGLPVVGFENRSWQRLAGASAAGLVVGSSNPEAMAVAVRELWRAQESMLRMATAARAFAARHTFEEEFGRRAASLRAVIESHRPRAAGQS